MNKKFLILGGYGNTGRLIAELLLKETDVHLVLAGRNGQKAEQLAEALNQKFHANRVSALMLDANNFESLRVAFQTVNFVIVASSTIDLVQNVSRAAIDARIDYLDTQLSTEAKLSTLRSLQVEMEKADCCFITDGGFHPGVPAALVRYAATFFDQLEQATVASLIKFDWNAYSFSDATVAEMIEEFKHFRPIAFQHGEWKKFSWKDYRSFDFGSHWGKKYCVPMMMEEMRELPGMFPSLKETGFFVAGFHWFTDYFIMPLVMMALKVAPQKAIKPSAKIFEWSLKAFSKPPFNTILLLEASGIKNDKPMHLRISLSHEDGYLLTAAPVVACLLKYLKSTIRQPGLWFQANIVEPKEFLEDMKRMGIQVISSH